MIRVLMTGAIFIVWLCLLTHNCAGIKMKFDWHRGAWITVEQLGQVRLDAWKPRAIVLSMIGRTPKPVWPFSPDAARPGAAII
jgi:hypothetical protein